MNKTHIMKKAEDDTWYDQDRVYFFHVRKYRGDGSLKNHAGCTVAAKIYAGGIVFTQAKCSKRDNFCRKIGRKVAEGRLVKGINIMTYPSFSIQRFSRFVFGKETIDESLKGEENTNF